MPSRAASVFRDDRAAKAVVDAHRHHVDVLADAFVMTSAGCTRFATFGRIRLYRRLLCRENADV
jgi:hypothetical protein